MKVKLRTRYAGPSGSYAPDTVVDLPDKEARVLIAARCAEKAPKQVKAEAKTAADAKAKADAAAAKKTKTETATEKNTEKATEV